MDQLIHLTAAYSNAVLTAILPHVSDFAKKLELPVPQPVTISQVSTFKPNPTTNSIGGVITLANGDRFWEIGEGHISIYYASSNCCLPPESWGPDQYYKLTNFWAAVTMTTNEMVECARGVLRKLGYDPKEIHADGPPTDFNPPYQFRGGTIPCCLVEWNLPGGKDIVTVSINAATGQVVRFFINSPAAARPSPTIDVVPELQADFVKRISGKMFVRTNAPPRLGP